MTANLSGAADDGKRKMQPGPGHGTATVAEGVRRIRAQNASAMTGTGTNTYIVGQGSVAVIDPGPPLAAHLGGILAALGTGETVSHILVTHAHLDHSGLAPALSRATGAPVLAFGPARAGRSRAMERLAQSDETGGEGIDAAFQPDIRLADGDRIDGGGWVLTALHTPGHMGNHLCFRFGDGVFSGDHAMGWSTSVISPPDGDMAAYMASLALLSRMAPAVLWPGHGDPVPEAAARLDWLAQHRRDREAQVLAALAGGPGNAVSLARHIYADAPEALLPAAARNVFAHLIDLNVKKLTVCEAPLGFGARFSLAAPG